MNQDKNFTDALPIGTVLIGNAYSYTIEKVLDQGAFGITYRARVKMSGPLGELDTALRVAIKEFFMGKINGRDETRVTGSKKNGTFSYYKEKFIKEARNLARLTHPNIVKVVEQFEANNTAYYVMEYIEGGSLDKKIEEKQKLEELQILRYVGQIGEALAFMHSRRMLHLDLKPKNVMLTTDDQVKLIDFGLAKQFDDSGKPETSTTIGNGTPGYAPLEQANYLGDTVDFPATMDIYAFGATIFKMASGHRPPEASDILNDGFPEDELEGISPRLRAVIAKAMAPVKKNRYQNVSEMLAALPKASCTQPHKESPATKKESEPEEDTIFASVTHDGKMDSSKESVHGSAAGDNPRETPKGHENRIEVDPSEGAGQKPRHRKRITIMAMVAVIAVAIGTWCLWPSGSKENSVVTGTINGHEWVDLGLSVKWASCNVGADSPSDYGDYFAWGEPSPKSSYTWSNCFDCLADTGDSWGIYKLGGKTQITPDSGHDTARENWGGTWRMPTNAELEELNSKCKWTWTSKNGHKGYVVTGPNGNSIFLPAAGYRDGSESDLVGSFGDYWSSTLSSNYSYRALYLYFSDSDHGTGDYRRRSGRSVRPVTE